MELVKVTVNQLDAFCKSEQFQRFTVKPISPLRVKSYIANPRSKGTDTVLYVLIEGGGLIAFRTVFADQAYIQDQPVRFGWCSGVWVDPEHRGKRLWKILLTEALADWENRLMFTNYAPNIRDLYLASGLFSELRHRSGYRFYLYPDFQDILSRRLGLKKSRLASTLLNFTARLLSDTNCLFMKKQVDFGRFDYIEIERPDSECLKRLNDRHLSLSLYRRADREFDWIFDFPWVTDQKENGFTYPFSYDEISYKTNTIKCFQDGKMIGFFIYSIVNRKMKILYHYEDTGITGSITRPIIQIARQYKIKHLTVLSDLLLLQLKHIKKYFIYSKKYESTIYTSFSVDADSQLIFDGDGDHCFT